MKEREFEVEVVNHFNDSVGTEKVSLELKDDQYYICIGDTFNLQLNENNMVEFVSETIEKQGYLVIFSCDRLGSEHIIPRATLIDIVRKACKILQPVGVLKTSTYYFNQSKQLLLEV